MPTPQLRFVVREQHEINHIETQLAGLESFVVKPAKGSGGKGILVVVGRRGDGFVKSSGALMSLADVRRHMSNTLAGLYSLGGTADVVIVEDIVDTGLTLNRIVKGIEERVPRSIRICALIDKLERRDETVKVDYCGFQVEKGFLVGYGLDHNEHYRNLPDIYILK